VNIVTKSGADLLTHVDVSTTVGTSDIRSGTVQAGGTTGPFSGIFLADFTHTGRIIDAPTFHDLHDNGDTLLLLGHGTVELTSHDSLPVLGLVGGANLQIPNTPEQQLVMDDRQRERNNFETLRWDHAFRGDLTLTSGFYHHGIEVRLLESAASTPFITNEQHHVDYYGVKSDLTFRGLPAHTFKAGFNSYLVRVSEFFAVVPNPPDPTFAPFSEGPRTAHGTGGRCGCSSSMSTTNASSLPPRASSSATGFPRSKR
jgi:hypothetical protein